MLKIGVLGAGHLGKIHLKLLNESKKYDLIGFFDTNKEYSKNIENEFGYKFFENIDELLDKIEVVDIVTPTVFHYDCAKKAINKGKHIFLEKPITNTIEEADELIKLLKEKKLKGQVGHVERFNPAFLAAKEYIDNPKFIEIHRLSPFNPRGTDVSVVMDLMIHDIDLILSLLKIKIKNIYANGVSLISDNIDICNARLEFENGCVANLTTSRISLSPMRKIRIFQKGAYINMDFLEKESKVISMENLPNNYKENEFDIIWENSKGEKKKIFFKNIAPLTNNAILNELEVFAESIENDTPEKVSFSDGKEALIIAKKILDIIEN